MATAISTLFSRLAPHLPGCPEPTIQQAVLDAAIDFCAETRIYNTFVQFGSTAGLQSYTLPAPTDSDEEIHTIMNVWWKTRHLGAAADYLIDYPQTLFSTSFSTQEKGDPRRWMRAQNGSFTVYPVPTAAVADGFTIQYAMKPRLTATTIPDLLIDQWRDAIISGALARLRSIPAKQWTAPAQMDAAMFNLGRARAKAVARQGQNGSPMRVNTRGFGR